MSQYKYQQNRKRPYAMSEEAKAWSGFYQRVSNPDIATEILKQLESDADMKREHLALYLCCKETLRTTKARQARNERIGQFVRLALSKVIATPIRKLFSMLRGGGALAVECLPEVRKEPAARQVAKVVKEPEFAQAQAVQPNAPAPTASQSAANQAG